MGDKCCLFHEVGHCRSVWVPLSLVSGRSVCCVKILKMAPKLLPIDILFQRICVARLAFFDIMFYLEVAGRFFSVDCHQYRFLDVGLSLVVSLALGVCQGYRSDQRLHSVNTRFLDVEVLQCRDFWFIGFGGR